MPKRNKQSRSTESSKRRREGTAKWDVFEDTEEVDRRAKRLDVADEIDKYEFVRPQDDEEITEDEAFDVEDEEKYGTFFAKKHDSDAESSESHFSEDDEETMDLSKMLDKEEQPPREYEKDFHALIPKALPTSHSSAKLEFSTDEESEEEEGDVDLLNLVDSIDQKAEMKKINRHITEAYPESEFNLAGQVNLQDLVGAVEETPSTFQTLKKQLSNFTDPTSKRSAETLNVPLHQRAKERLERTAAYEQTKSQVSKWTNIVKKNREATFVDLSSNDKTAQNVTSGSLVSSFAPQTSLESKLDDLMKETGMTEKKYKENESLLLNKLSKEDVEARRVELSKLRSLLFFQEMKQKRVNKIKSKKYRKINKKQKEKNGELGYDEIKDLDPEAAQDLKMKMEEQRAKERMSLKHKNTGKWAKQMLGRPMNDETRQALMEQLTKHDLLKKKITGVDSDDDSDEDADSDAQLNELEEEIEETEVPTKGVFGMKFMQRAFEKQKKGVLSDIARLRDEFDDQSDSEAEDEIIEEKPKSKSYKKDHPELEKKYLEQMEALKYDGVNGEDKPAGFRANVQDGTVTIEELKDRSYVAKQYEQEDEESEAESSEPKTDAESEEEEQIESEKEADDHIDVQEVTMESDDQETVNPWLAPVTKLVQKPKSQTTSLSRLQAARFGKSLSKLQKDRKERLTEKQKREDDSKVLVQKPAEARKVMIESDDDSDVEQTQNVELIPIKKFTKKKVLEMAFENDQLELDFEEEVAKSEKPEMQSDLLPGWGNWSNTKAVPKKVEVEEKKVTKEKKLVQVAPSIPSKKYMSVAVPHNFENKAQFERFHRMPLGKSWMPQSVFKKTIQPRVKVRPGQVIEAMSWKK